MTSRTPNRPPSKRPSLQQPVLLERGAAGVGGAGDAGSSKADDARTSNDALLQQFEAVLQGDLGVDRETLDLLKQQFSQAVEDAAAVGGSGHAAIPDRAQWMDAMQALRASGEVSEAEVNDLIRQINQALQPLQRRESQIAIEFSRRIQSEGQEKALAWFREETGKASAEQTTDSTSSSSPSGDVSPLLRSEVVNSRSRRLRGPPDGS